RSRYDDRHGVRRRPRAQNFTRRIRAYHGGPIIKIGSSEARKIIRIPAAIPKCRSSVAQQGRLDIRQSPQEIQLSLRARTCREERVNQWYIGRRVLVHNARRKWGLPDAKGTGVRLLPYVRNEGDIECAVENNRISRFVIRTDVPNTHVLVAKPAEDIVPRNLIFFFKQKTAYEILVIDRLETREPIAPASITAD